MKPFRRRFAPQKLYVALLGPHNCLTPTNLSFSVAFWLLSTASGHPLLALHIPRQRRNPLHWLHLLQFSDAHEVTLLGIGTAELHVQKLHVHLPRRRSAGPGIKYRSKMVKGLFFSSVFLFLGGSLTFLEGLWVSFGESLGVVWGVPWLGSLGCCLGVAVGGGVFGVWCLGLGLGILDMFQVSSSPEVSRPPSPDCPTSWHSAPMPVGLARAAADNRRPWVGHQR